MTLSEDNLFYILLLVGIYTHFSFKTIIMLYS